MQGDSYNHSLLLLTGAAQEALRNISDPAWQPGLDSSSSTSNTEQNCEGFLWS